MSRAESSARIEENDIHKSWWILSSADLFLLSQAKIAVVEHEELSSVTNESKKQSEFGKGTCLVACEGERNKCLLDQTEQKKSFIF